MKKTDCTRRSFLRRATAAAAGAVATPFIVSSTVLGRGGISAPSERVALGHIGVGGRGSSLLRQFLALPHAQSIAVCDSFASRRQARAKDVDKAYADREKSATASGCASYRDYRELLAREDIDAVIIATPDHWHVPAAIHAVRAGKDVYVEKPLGLAVAWNQALRKVIKKHDAVFQYGTQQRSGRSFRFACELVRNGKIGKLERMHAWCAGMAAPGWYESTSKGGGSTKEIPVPPDLDYDMWIGPAPLSTYTKDRCTQWGAYHVYDNSLGFIAGWGAHPLDIAQWGNDSDSEAPVEYEGTGKVPEVGIFNTVSDWDIRCRYANGVALRFMNMKTAVPVVQAYRPMHDHGTTFFGSEGWVSVDRGGLHVSDEALKRQKLENGAVKLYESPNHYKNFVDCVKSRAPTVSTIESAVQSDIICHLSDICVRVGRKIRWDPAQEKIRGDEQASRMLNRPLRSPWRL